MATIDFDEIAATEVAGYKVVKKLVKLKTAKRHAVRIGGIKANKNRYQEVNAFQSRELISTPVKSIALFCNEYVPSHFPAGTKYITYILTINGTDHEVVPVNANRDGMKIIRMTGSQEQSLYVIHLNEEIKSATLKVIIKTPNVGESPHFSNLKILIGGE